MRKDGQVINPEDNGANSEKRPRTTDRKDIERAKGGIEGSGSTACRSPSLLAGLWRKIG